MPGLLSYDYGDAAAGKIKIRPDGTIDPSSFGAPIILGENGWVKDDLTNGYKLQSPTERELAALRLLLSVDLSTISFDILDPGEILSHKYKGLSSTLVLKHFSAVWVGTTKAVPSMGVYEIRALGVPYDGKCVFLFVNQSEDDSTASVMIQRWDENLE